MTEPRRVGFLWCSLAVAFSPSLYNLGESLWEAPWQRYVLFSVLLIALRVRNLPNPDTPKRLPRIGSGLLLFGLITQLFGIAAGSWSIARCGLPLAMLGISLITGRPKPRVVVLAFGVIPIPDFVIHATSPWLESALATMASNALALVGIAMNDGGPLLQYRGAFLELQPSDSGLVTAVLFAETGWYAALCANRSSGQSIRRAIGCALLAIVLQPLAVLLCVASLPMGLAHFGRFTLTYGFPIMLAATVLIAELRMRSSPEPPGANPRTGP